jgi:hypothetical protein
MSGLVLWAHFIRGPAVNLAWPENPSTLPVCAGTPFVAPCIVHNPVPPDYCQYAGHWAPCPESLEDRVRRIEAWVREQEKRNDLLYPTRSEKP